MDLRGKKLKNGFLGAKQALQKERWKPRSGNSKVPNPPYICIGLKKMAGVERGLSGRKCSGGRV